MIQSMLHKFVLPVKDSLEIELERFSKRLPKKASFEVYSSSKAQQFQLFRDHLPDLTGFTLSLDEVDVDEFGTRVATAGDFSRPIITASLPLISYTALEFKHGPWAGIRAAHRFDADGAVLLLSIDNIPDPTERAARFEQLFTTLALDGIVVNRTNSCGFMIASKKYQIRTTVAQLGGLNPSAITIGGLADPAQYAIFLQTQEDMGVLTRMITLTKDTYQNARSSIQEKTAWVIRFFGMAPASCPVLRPCAEFSWKDGKFLQIDEDLPAQQLIVYANFSL